MGSESSWRRLEARVERMIRESRFGARVDAQRLVRAVEFVLVGASGAIVDVTITSTLLGTVHYLVANLAGFAVAVTWNFLLNYSVTFDSPDGSVLRKYPTYVGWHSGTFLLRVVVVATLVEGLGSPVLFASGVGIVVAATANFLGAEAIFGVATVSPTDLRSAVGSLLNRVVHRVYTGRVERALHRTGLYAPLYGCYQRVLAAVYPADTRRIEFERASATVYMTERAEILSVLHTLRKEENMLTDFVASLRRDDVVWDVGANLGVFTLLAADVIDEPVICFEPHPSTYGRLVDNIALNDRSNEVLASTSALSNSSSEDAELGLERDELGTQTGSLNSREGQETVTTRTVIGDELINEFEMAPAPDVLKVDVEGAELDVLEGLADALDDCRLVFVEDHSELWGTERVEEGLRLWLEAKGFDVTAVEQGNQTYYRGER